jgi:predicted DNA-binding transcriptional regulator AlpA
VSGLSCAFIHTPGQTLQGTLDVVGRKPRLGRYGDAVDVKRAAELYSQGWTLRQIGAELGVHWSTVSQQLQRAGIRMRSGGPPAHPTSTQEILELRDQGLTWNEVAKQVGMTRSGAWSRYRRTRPPKQPRLGRWQQVHPSSGTGRQRGWICGGAVGCRHGPSGV